jgi:hypothetical protein
VAVVDTITLHRVQEVQEVVPLIQPVVPKQLGKVIQVVQIPGVVTRERAAAAQDNPVKMRQVMQEPQTVEEMVEMV